VVWVCQMESFLSSANRDGAAAILERKFKDPAYHQAYREQEKKLGSNPSDKVLLETRLLANPDKVRLRVYQTNSTHKSMSCLRQGSMVLVKDPDYHTVEEQFHEAVFTHASTSPNLQIIASLDIARRQMELEDMNSLIVPSSWRLTFVAK